MANSFGSQLAWKLATRAALKGDALTVKPVHLLIGCGMLCDRLLEQQLSANVRVGLEQEITEARGLFARAGLYHPSHFVTLLEQKLNPAVPRDGTARPDPDPDARVLSIIARARVLAWQSGTATGEVRLAHLLLATGELHPAPWDSILRELQAEPLRKSWANVPVGAAPVLTVHEPPPPPVPTPTLDELGRDLTRLARERQLTPQIGREKERAALVAILQQRGKGNPLILGEAGVGKTSLVEGLALYLTGPDAPPSLAKCRVIELAANTLMADTKYRGELEERIKQVLTEAATPNIILFIDEIHTLVQRTHSDGQMLTEAFKPGLNDGRLRIIGATTNDEFTRYIQPDPALERRFQVVRVEEPSREEAITILNGMRPTLERQQGVIVTGEAVVAAVDLSIRYQPQLRLPAKASDLLLQAAARARIAPPAAGRRSPGALNVGLVDRPQVAQVMAEKVGLPPAVMTAAEGTRLRGLEATLARRVMGQDEAIEALANAIRMSRAGLRAPQKPVGVFLFVGPTGTGKTESAKALAEFLFGDEGQRLIRIDMSEYQEEHAAMRLIGYAGPNNEGTLAGPVRKYPFSVILLDEIEKAHPRVLDLFLQVFDDGRLADQQGRQVQFGETVIIMTSNLGAQRRRVPGIDLGRNDDAERERVFGAVREALRPELLGRLTMIYFRPLNLAVRRQIFGKVLHAHQERLAERQIALRLTDAARDWLLESGEEDGGGGRAIAALLDRQVIARLSQGLVGGVVRDGMHLLVDLRDGALVFLDQRARKELPLGPDRRRQEA